MKTLSNTEALLKKSVAYKKCVLKNISYSATKVIN